MLIKHTLAFRKCLQPRRSSLPTPRSFMLRPAFHNPAGVLLQQATCINTLPMKSCKYMMNKVSQLITQTKKRS